MVPRQAAKYVVAEITAQKDRREYSQITAGCIYTGADKSLARPGRNQANVSVRVACISFGALFCREKNLMTARVSMLLKARASLICFRACFLPGRAKDYVTL